MTLLSCKEVKGMVASFVVGRLATPKPRFETTLYFVNLKPPNIHNEEIFQPDLRVFKI